MQNSQLNRVIKLIKRTGEKTVIMDNESDAALMLMDLDAYEKMLGNSSGVEKLTEEELLEKINRDVAIWRAYNDKERVETYEIPTPEGRGSNRSVGEVPQTTFTPTPAPVYVSKSEEAVVMSRNSGIPLTAGERGKDVNLVMAENFNGAAMAGQAEQEQSASDIVAEEDEEKFYLEPVE